jgi:hypothetical protein
MKKLILLALCVIPTYVAAENYWLQCDGETTQWSTLSNEYMKYKDTKTIKIVAGEIDKMDCSTNNSKTRMHCTVDIKNTNLPKIKSLKTSIELNMKTLEVNYVSESKVTIEEALKQIPEIKSRIGNNKYSTNESVFKGQCKKR